MTETTTLEAIRTTLAEAMRADERVLVLGEDVAEGGPWGATAGLAEEFGAERVAILHRNGVLKIGEASVGIAIATPHRAESFQACQYAIDRLKQIVPIWKKEVWASGEQWIGWEGQAPADLAAPTA